MRQITDAVAAVPGVRDVALTSALPLQGWGYGVPFRSRGQVSGHLQQARLLLQDGGAGLLPRPGNPPERGGL